MEGMSIAAHALASFAHFLHAQSMRNIRQSLEFLLMPSLKSSPKKSSPPCTVDLSLGTRQSGSLLNSSPVLPK
jgi:hypothetical protein